MSTLLIDRSGGDDDDDEPIVRPDDDTAEARADAALRRIAGGADPAAEAFDLANRLTDDTVARIRRWFSWRPYVGDDPPL